LYSSLSKFVESEGGGLVGQSFRSALGLELRSYLKLVATLEGQIRRALATLDDTLPRNGIGKAGVTLKRCVYWTREATMGLRLMSLMVEDSKSKDICTIFTGEFAYAV
jgi:gamma-tubulin complex component 3